jgi:hypothetical protein
MKPSRRALLGLLAVILAAYGVGLIVFVTQGRDFIVARNNGRAETVAAGYPDTLPASYTFKADHPDTALLGAGWWTPETDGVWSRAQAYVALPAGAGPAVLLVDAQPFTAHGHESASLALSIDGAQVASWTVGLGEVLPATAIEVPAEAAADGLLMLHFDIATAAVPEHFGLGDDDREVGVFLRRITLEPTPAARE